MDYKEAIEFIEGASGKGSKNGTKNMVKLMAKLGDPHKRLKAFHVAGTNGKGSICAFLDTALQTAGYRTGLYTSPHLERFNERIRLCGRPVSDDKLAEVTSIVAEKVNELRLEGVLPTFFEICTAVAFTFFAMENVDYAVIEVGLGGRLDSTNVITPMVSLIASIGMDHMKTLGNTIEEIAGEKAGIIKQGIPVVTNPQPESVRAVFEQMCARTGSELYDLSTSAMQMIFEDERGGEFSLELGDMEWPKIEIALPGVHQAQNAACAVVALTIARRQGLKISDAQILAGIKHTRWPGRLEWIEGSPRLLLDGAHNGPGAKTLLEYARRHLMGKHVVLLTAMLGDKPVEDVVRQLAGITSQAIVTHISDTARALEPKRLAVLLEANAVSCQIEPDMAQALNTAKRLAGADGIVLISGSLYLIGQIRSMLNIGDEGCI